jgi:ribonuclease VapC
MIALDTSVLVAIVLGEPDAELYVERLRAGQVIVGAPTVLESAIVVEARQGPDAARDLELLIDRTAREIPFGSEHARSAVRAWRRFGKGRHSAALNFGDCLAYAVADVAGCPLLFKGQDFRSTDIAAALPD